VRFLILILLLSACSAEPSKSSVTPLPTPPPVRDISEVDVWAPRDLSDLEAIARTGTQREIVTRRTGSLPQCPSVSIGILEPEGTPPEQVNADLVRAMLGEPHSQCNGGNIWGFKTKQEASGGSTYTNGWIKLDNDHGKHTAKFVLDSETKWTVTY
jgi:hypothetical protein